MQALVSFFLNNKIIIKIIIKIYNLNKIFEGNTVEPAKSNDNDFMNSFSSVIICLTIYIDFIYRNRYFCIRVFLV
jgi:hypothetical protein